MDQIIFPVELFYPGAPKVRVGDERTLLKYQAQGWTLQPKPYTFQQYPTVLYFHKDFVEAHNDEEYKKYIDKGYSPSPKGPFGAAASDEIVEGEGPEEDASEDEGFLMGKIRYHLDEASFYQAKLDALKPSQVPAPVPPAQPARRGRKKKAIQ